VTVVSILGIMAVIGLPLFTATLQTSRLDAAARQIMSDLQEARSRATLTGWQYRIVGYKIGGGSPYENQYRLVGRNSSAVAWPADNSGVFESATQMGGPWINIDTLYSGVRLNPQDGNPSFWVSFDPRGVPFEISAGFSPLRVTHETGTTRSVRVSSVGGIRAE
jgi:type II secretory pathway pseudopilin PulG